MKVLVVEDERALREIIKDFLTKENYVVETAEDFFKGQEKLVLYQYDCILLDIMMPGGSGMDLLKEIRSSEVSTPVIILSAKDSLEDKIEGLDLGADDYLPKPFHLTELLARIKSVVRRANGHQSNQIQYKNIMIMLDERSAYVGTDALLLNRKEFDILYYFMIRPEKLIQKIHLAESIWGDSVDQVDNLDFIYSQIKNLRKKLKDGGAEADIQAVYGVGYKMV